MEQSARITAITIENFKGISKPVTVPLRPITLLFGKNSAGKSTILQAMLFALEIIRTGRADIDKIQLGGDSINLGGFRNLVHKHDLSRTIRLRFDLQLGQFGLEAFWLHDEWGLYEDLADDALGNLESAFVELKISMKNGLPQIIEYTTGTREMAFASIASYGQSHSVNIDYTFADDTKLDDDPLIHTAKLAMLIDEDSINDVIEVSLNDEEGLDEDAKRDVAISSQLDKLDNFQLKNQTSCIPRLHVPLEFEKAKLAEFDDDLIQSKSLQIFFSRVLVRPIEILAKQLEKIRYIGPIREIPERNHQAPISANESRWANGLAAWDALYKATPAEDAESDGLIEKTNDYLRNVLTLGYELCRKNVIEIDVNGQIMNILRKAAVQFEEIDEQQLRNAVLNGLENQPVKRRLSLHDLDNEVDVTPSDIGVGVSQVVPVVVGVLAKTAENKLPSILAIEQPELHIHPAVQCALGDLFICEKSNNRIFLIETHSEHLLLRIMKRMRQSSDKSLPAWFPETIKDNISLLFVENSDEEMLVRDMPLNERGELVKAWPGGFFEEGLQEVF